MHDIPLAAAFCLPWLLEASMDEAWTAIVRLLRLTPDVARLVVAAAPCAPPLCSLAASVSILHCCAIETSGGGCGALPFSLSIPPPHGSLCLCAGNSG